MQRVLFGLGFALLAAAGVFALSIIGGSHSTLVVSPERLAFGEIAAGESARRVLVVTNTGDEPLAIRLMEAEAPFVLSSSALSLGPGQAQAVVVTFAPTESGRAEGELILENAALKDGIRAVPLEGSAYRPAEIGVEPRFLSFGEVRIGETAKAPITIANRGEADLEVGSLAVSRPFRAEVELTTVASAATRSVEVYFEPRAAGDYEAALTIRSNDPERGAVFVYVEGAGVEHAPTARIGVNPPKLDFGAVPVGGSQTQRISVRNTGEDPLTVTALQAPAHFSVPARSRQIEPGERLSLPVTFSPSGEGGLRGTLSIFSNDPQQQVIAVGLSGEGDRRTVAADSRGAGDPLVGASAESQPGIQVDLAAGAPDDFGSSEEGPDFGSPEEGPDGNPPAPEPPRPDELPPASELEEGYVRLGSYSEKLSSLHADSVSYEPTSGAFAINGLQIPTVDAALGEYFQFDSTAVVGRFNGDGDAEIRVPVRLYDFRGNPVDMTLELTTGVAPANVKGTEIALEGRPLGSDGRATLVGFAEFPDRSPFGGGVMRLSLNVRVNGVAVAKVGN